MNAIVISGGHRGVTATHGGFSAAVIELRRVSGGPAVTEYVELKLKRQGMKLDPTSFSDAGCLLFEELDRTEISDFSFRDADNFSRYKSQLESFCKLLDPIRHSPPPEISEDASSYNGKMKNDSGFWSACHQHAVSPGQEEMGDITDLLLSPTSNASNNWIEACGWVYRFCLLSPSTLLQRKLEFTQ